MIKKLVILSLSTIVLTACAKRPDAITATNIPIAAYQNLDCTQLANELILENEKLAALSKSQNQAATADAVGVFLVGIPAGSVTGNDKEGQIAVSKGKVISIESASKAKGCETIISSVN